MRKILTVIILFCSNFCYSQMLSPSTDSGHRVSFYGLTSLNSSNEELIESITASGRLAVEFFPGAVNGRFKVNIGANLLNANPSNGIKKDSLDFNSLMFPETGNFGFLFNPSLRLYSWADKEHTISLDGTYAYRKVAIDSPDVSFKINSVNIGLKYTWAYPDKDFTFNFMGYWNLFNIPDEDVTKFNALTKDPLFEKNDQKSEIYSLGMKTSLQYKSFIFFADLRKNINTSNLDDNNPFKGTKFNIGFATKINLKSF